MLVVLADFFPELVSHSILFLSLHNLSVLLLILALSSQGAPCSVFVDSKALCYQYK